MIKAVPQRNNYDCAYATVAMASNKTYDEVADLVRKRIFRPKAGLTTNEQLFLLEQLTGEVWESYTAPENQRLVNFTATFMPDQGETDDARMILSTYKRRNGRVYLRHSIFFDGRRIYCPTYAMWIPFSKLRRMRRYQGTYINELLVPAGTITLT